VSQISRGEVREKRHIALVTPSFQTRQRNAALKRVPECGHWRLLIDAHMTFSPRSVANLSSVAVPTPKNKACPHYNHGPRAYSAQRNRHEEENGLRQVSLVKIFWKLLPDPDVKLGFKCHRILDRLHHHVHLFESHYNYRIVTEIHDRKEITSIPAFESLTNGNVWRGVGTDSFMSQLGKTNVTPQEDVDVLDLRPHKKYDELRKKLVLQGRLASQTWIHDKKTNFFKL